MATKVKEEKTKENQVRTRFAPSPTGLLHIGSLRTALFSYAYAKSKQGKFVLRIEDTDRNRFVPEATEKIYSMLKLFGLSWDEGPVAGGSFGPYVQSERVKTGLYQKYAQQLISQGNAYYCFCPPVSSKEREEDRQKKTLKLRDPCRDLSKAQVEEKLNSKIQPAIRLRVPDNEKVSYFDFVFQKEVVWETKDIDEVMLLKSDGFPTYHLGVVVDDVQMQISHIIRGHDWLPSTPVHLLIFKYLGFDLPQIGHLTDILDPQGGKLSKRRGSVTCEEMLQEGYLPEAVLNFIMLLGWAPKNNRELYTLDEFVQDFPKGDLQVSNPIFNREKLDWFNGHYLRQKTDSQLAELFKEFLPQKTDSETLEKIIPLVKDRMVKLAEISTFAGFFFAKPKVDLALFKQLPYQEHLKKAVDRLEKVTTWNNEEIQKTLGGLIAQENWKTGDFYMSLRVALAGSRFTPPITESAGILGKEETIARLKGFGSNS